MDQSIKQHNENFAICGQLSPEDLAEVARLGFRSVICNRPDHEGGAEQPTSETLAREAGALGLRFAYLPVVANAITPDHVRQMKALLDELPAPVLAFCRTGNRSAILYDLTRQPGV